MQFEDRIVVDVVVESFCTQDEPSDHLARVNRLGGIGDDPGFDRLHDPIGKKFRMDTEVFVILKMTQDGV